MLNTDIENADFKLTIEVSLRAIAKARRKDPYHCVFADACSRMPEVEEAIIHISTAYIKFHGDDKWMRFRVNSKMRAQMRAQIIAYDQEGVFEPGEYTLAPIQPSHRATGWRQGGKSFGPGRRTGAKEKRTHVRNIRAPARISAL